VEEIGHRRLDAVEIGGIREVEATIEGAEDSESHGLRIVPAGV